MLESQVELRDKIKGMFNKYREIMPDIASAYDELPTEVYKDGVLSGKIKRLMALTAALVHGCRACILYQTDLSLDQGANVEEISPFIKNNKALFPEVFRSYLECRQHPDIYA